MPIWDKYMVQSLKVKVSLASDPNRIQKMENLYDGIVACYADFLKTENARQCLAKFDEKKFADVFIRLYGQGYPVRQ